MREQKPPSAMHKTFRVLGPILGLFLIVVIGFILLVPTLISTDWGKEQTLQLINSQIPGTLTAKSIHLSWTGIQKFEEVSLKTLEGETIAYFDSFTCKTPLINFLRKGPSIGKTELKGGGFNVVEEYPEVTNFHQALGTKSISFSRKKDKVIIHLPFTAKITLKQKQRPRNFQQPKPIILRDVNLLCEANSFAKPLTFYLSGTTEQGSLKGEFLIDAQVSSGKPMHWLFDRNATVKLEANIRNFPIDLFDLVLTMDQPQLQGILRDAFGDSFSLSVNQELNKDNGLFHIIGNSPTFETEMFASLENGKYLLSQTGKIAFTITPEFFDRIAKRSRNTPLLRLANPAQTCLTIESLSLPVDFEDTYPNAIDFSGMSIQANLDVQDIDLTGSPFWGEVSVKGVTSTVEAHENSTCAVWKLRGDADQNGQHLQIKLDAMIHKPNEGEKFLESIRKNTNLKVQLAGVPLVQLSNFPLNSKELLSSLIGPFPCTTLDLKFEDKSLQFTCTVESDKQHSHLYSYPLASANISGVVQSQGTSITLNGLSNHQGEIRGQLHLSGYEKGIEKAKLSGNLKARDIVFSETKSGLMQDFAKVDLTLASDALSRSIYLESHLSNAQGSIACTATVSSFFKTPYFNFNLDMQHQNFPKIVAMTCPKNHCTKKLQALFGNSVSGKISAELKNGEGPINLSLNGECGKLAADLSITDGIMTLNAPLSGEFVMTPLLGKKVLSEFVPVFRNVTRAEQLLKVTIDSKDFCWPLAMTSWENSYITKAQVDFGKVFFQKSGEIRAFINLLETDGKEDVAVWFTPLYLTMNRGVVDVDRFDMLFMEHYPLAAWGRVDLVKDKMRMTLGLTKEALNYAFAVEQLEDGYVMQLPMKGKLNEATIDKNKAAAKISALVAQNCAQGSDHLLKSIIDLAAGELAQNNKPTPPPTTSPFPWNVLTASKVY